MRVLAALVAACTRDLAEAGQVEVVDRDRVAAARIQSDTEFLARELAAVRFALADVVTTEDLSDRMNQLEKMISDLRPADSGNGRPRPSRSEAGR